MFEQLPAQLDELMTWKWEQFAPYYEELNKRSLNADTLEQWMQDWSLIGKHASELYNRIYIDCHAIQRIRKSSSACMILWIISSPHWRPQNRS